MELHRLISATVGNPRLAARLAQDAETVYGEFEVPQAQAQALLANPRHALTQLDVHPNLQFKLLAALGLLSLPPASIQPYLQDPHRDGKDR
ncbi:hypothetical protein [Variovorax sp. E3]|uniref:hypothetical protein n=1 Tax=Variovorax sp. E3 TaxID=1914993 RepID=UPI0018DC8110|nr:hypothetical protein [Variovorax sp. E3]